MDIQRDEAFEESYSNICKPIIARPYPRKENGEYAYKEIHEAYLMWQAKAQAVPEGFVLVPKELSDDLADELASDAFNNSQSLFDHEYRDYSAAQKEQLRLRWCRNKAIDYQRNYADMVKAQEQSHD